MPQGKKSPGSSTTSSHLSLQDLEHLDEEDPSSEFPLGLGCALDVFREKEEVLQIINSLDGVTTEKDVEIKYETFRKILDRYQEQPHLLDPHLDDMIRPLLQDFTKSTIPFKLLHHLFKVRGPKNILKKLPHEVTNVLQVVERLEKENLEDPATWEVGYVLTYWLSLLVMNPFSLRLLDPSMEGRLYALCKRIVQLNSSVGQQAGVYLVGRVMTRSDMVLIHLGKWIRWCSEVFQNGTSTSRVGCCSSLASVCKQANRKDLLKHANGILDTLMTSKYEQSKDTNLRKAATKLVQRIGMTFLKTKQATWRYQRGSRRLLENLTTTGTAPADAVKAEVEDEDYSELAEYSAQVESVLDKLLNSLKDKDTVVRWSAAKGLGRVTNRLPKDYADEVVLGLIQQCFTEREGHTAWHGGCLALAELARRGLLLPERIPDVLPVVKRAIIYDEIVGNFSIGSSVRDAACYVYWAFARAFEPEILEPHVNEIATCLIIGICFDREINCRRAASAAFQENVGRQGNFPNGIDIVMITDYFTVGNRANSYGDVCKQISAFNLYNKPMIDHLLALKFYYFDDSIRHLTAASLGMFCTIETDYVMEKVFPELLQATGSTEIYRVHGALLSLTEILRSLYSINYSFDEVLLKRIRDVTPNIISKRFSQRGTEYLKQGMCGFVGVIAEGRLPFHDDQELLTINKTLFEDCLSSVDAQTRLKAGENFPLFLQEYVGDVQDMLKGYCIKLDSSSMATRQGYAAFLGRLPTSILKHSFECVITSLSKCSSVTKDTETWAESRKEALLSMGNIFSRKFDIGEDSSLDASKIHEIYRGLFKNVEDYTLDKRGDIGSWVRKAAMSTLKVLSIRCATTIDPDLLKDTIGFILKQCVEKIDNVRVHACLVFAKLVHSGKMDGRLPCHSSLLEIFPLDFCNSVNWRQTSHTFSKFSEVLALEPYSYPLLEGFAISGGAAIVGSSVMKDANGAVKNYLVASGSLRGDEELERIFRIVLQILERNRKHDRVSVPAMRFITQLLQSGILLPILKEELGLNLIELVKLELAKCGKVENLIAGTELYCELLQSEDSAVVKGTMRKLGLYLGHIYPRVRSVASQKLYEALMTYGGDLLGPPDVIDEVMRIVSDTSWERIDHAVARERRDGICALLNVPVPVKL